MNLKYFNNKLIVAVLLLIIFMLASCTSKDDTLKNTRQKNNNNVKETLSTKKNVSLQKDSFLNVKKDSEVSVEQVEEILRRDFNSKNVGQTSAAYFEKFGQTNMNDEIHVIGYAQVKSYVKSKMVDFYIYESLSGYGNITKIIFKENANKEYQFESIEDFDMKNDDAYYKKYSNDDPKLYNKLKSELDINQLQVDIKLVNQLGSELSKKKDIKKYTLTDIKSNKGLVDLGYSKDYKGKKFKQIALRDEYDRAIKENSSNEKSVYVDGFYFIEDQGIFIKDYAMYSIYADVK